ncbi:MAG: Ig-like domain-containing protein [Pseudomonadota bacterium]|nr:Ig-like domain-containing protein [Pseudomonadota bacterium]
MRWLTVLFTFLWCVPAWAGVVWVPSPPLLGDGVTPSTVRLYVDDGQKIRVKADTGKVGPAIAGADGVWTIPYTPPRVTAVGTVAFKVTVGGAETSIDVPVVPPFTGELQLTFDPPVLPSTGTALVKIEPEGSSPVASEGRGFLLVASAGTLEAVTPAGNGTWVARYTPPKGLTAPLAVVFAATDAAAPDKVQGSAVLPVTVKRSVSFDVKPGSSNVMKVGSRTYGPLVAAPSGKVAFDIDLDPREPTGDLRSVNTDTSKEDREAPLPIAATTAIAFYPLPTSVPAQGDLAVPVRIVVIGPDGEPKADATVKLTTSKGTVTPATWDREVFSASFTPPTTPGEITLTAEVDGAKAERKIKIVGTIPTVTLVSEPVDIAKTGTSFSVVARVKDAQGTGVVGRPPTLTVDGATANGTPKDNKDGSYTFAYKVSSSTNRVRIYAAPPVETSSMPAARLVAWPGAATVAANGSDTVTVTVLAVDAFGLPVPNVTLKLGAPRGDGSVPPTAKTDARGMARILFTAGRTPGLASVRVEGAGLVTEVPLFQAKDGAAPMLPTGGGPSDEALVAKWKGAAPELKVIREGVVPPSGPPATVQISTVPPYTTPGAAILLNIRVMDSAGVGVGGKKLSISASPAAVGQITDNRDGTYAVPLQLPAGQDGPIVLTVGVESATGSVTLPTLAMMGTQQPTAGTGSAPRQSPVSGGGGGSVARVPAPSAAVDFAKLRIGFGLLNARGSYTMTSDAGAQLLGAASFATPGAGFFGLAAEGVWLPLQQSWGALGLDVRGRSQLEWFKVGENPFINVQRDAILAARYRRGLGGLFSVEGTLGAHYTTGVLFRYSDAARSKAELLNFPLFGARLGALASLESDLIYASLEIAETFAPFPIDTHAELLVDVRLTDSGTTFRAGGSWDYRSMQYAAAGEGDETGAAAVQQQQFTVRIGAGQVF